jgi:hypothetical protein
MSAGVSMRSRTQRVQMPSAMHTTNLTGFDGLFTDLVLPRGPAIRPRPVLAQGFFYYITMVVVIVVVVVKCLWLAKGRFTLWTMKLSPGRSKSVDCLLNSSWDNFGLH